MSRPRRWILMLLMGAACPLWARAAEPALEILVLGSGGPGAAGRAGSSYLVYADGVARILVDAGPGSFVRLGEAKASLAKVDIVLLTHLHIDHVGEIPGLFKARAVSGSGPITFNVFGPAGALKHGEDAYFPSTSEFMRSMFGAKGAFAYLSDFAAPITMHPHDIPAPAPNSMPRKIFEDRGLEISAVAGHHGDAPSVIYRIDHAGTSVTFSGDIDTAGLPALRRIGTGTGLLVFNSVVLDPPGSPTILYTLHTPPRAIGELAKEVGAKQLLLSHLSPSVEDANAAVLASVRRNYSGPTVFAKDGLKLQP